MRSDIKPGGVFPDYALPDHTNTVRKLSEIQGTDPMIITLARGNYCPKEHQQHLELAANHPKIAVAYTQVVTISTDDHHSSQEFRGSVGADWPFLSDPERKVQKDLEIQEYTDPEHNPMIPHTLVVKPGLVIHSIYNGYWFWGRPSFYDLWRRPVRGYSRDTSRLGSEQAWTARGLGCRRLLELSWMEQADSFRDTDLIPVITEVVVVRTPVCELLGVEQPIVQAPMSAVPELAAAVSNAGGLGMLALTWSTPAGDVVRETQKLTDRPFGGNLLLNTDQHRRVDEALEAGLRIVSLMWGDPASYVEQVHDAKALLLQSVGSAEEARRAVGSGVDVIVAQGWEAGGHVWSRIATLPLVPAVVDAVAPVPVIAAGGIGDARGVAAVFALGAQAAWLGTRFLLANEMPAHDEYRHLLIDADETEARWYPDLFAVGWPDAPHRVLHNSTAKAWEAAGRPPLGSRPGEGEVIAHFASGDPIVRYETAAPMVGTTGEIEALSLWAGQSVGLIRQQQSAAEIVAELVSRL